MGNENIQKFEEMLRSDEGVQAKLKAAVEAYDGDKADEKAIYEATIGKVAGELGFSVSYEDARDYAQKLVAIDDGELDAVAGGRMTCYIVGGTKGIETEDVACAYIGLSIDLK